MIQKWLPLLFSAVAMTLSIATFFKSDAPHTAASDGGTFSSSTRRKLQSFEESTDSIDSATFTLNTIQHKRRGFRRTGETHACDLSGQCPAGVQGSQGDKGNDGPPGKQATICPACTARVVTQLNSYRIKTTSIHMKDGSHMARSLDIPSDT